MNSEDHGPSSDMVKLYGGCAKVVTDKAILFHTPVFPGNVIEVWFPKSAAEIDPEDSGLWVERWLIEKKQKELNETILLDDKFN